MFGGGGSASSSGAGGLFGGAGHALGSASPFGASSGGGGLFGSSASSSAAASKQESSKKKPTWDPDEKSWKDGSGGKVSVAEAWNQGGAVWDKGAKRWTDATGKVLPSQAVPETAAPPEPVDEGPAWAPPSAEELLRPDERRAIQELMRLWDSRFAAEISRLRAASAAALEADAAIQKQGAAQQELAEGVAKVEAQTEAWERSLDLIERQQAEAEDLMARVEEAFAKAKADPNNRRQPSAETREKEVRALLKEVEKQALELQQDATSAHGCRERPYTSPHDVSSLAVDSFSLHLDSMEESVQALLKEVQRRQRPPRAPPARGDRFRGDRRSCV